MEWLWIAGFVLLIAGVLIFLPLLGRNNSSSRSTRKSVVQNSQKDPVKGGFDETSSRTGGSRIHRERDEMLEGVRNLARDNPKKVASMVRDWMKE
ncbi:MAG: hypothetical protein CMN76_15090 [Spirochaetaceae bacterium]|nr:hypothetical protein [Spirochaetaceae bacterium]